jgi:hypothetical protein
MAGIIRNKWLRGVIAMLSLMEEMRDGNGNGGNHDTKVGGYDQKPA